jgi:hypothetical protein
VRLVQQQVSYANGFWCMPAHMNEDVYAVNLASLKVISSETLITSVHLYGNETSVGLGRWF